MKTITLIGIPLLVIISVWNLSVSMRAQRDANNAVQNTLLLAEEVAHYSSR